jgi:hypothetical protein
VTSDQLTDAIVAVVIRWTKRSLPPTPALDAARAKYGVDPVRGADDLAVRELALVVFCAVLLVSGLVVFALVAGLGSVAGSHAVYVAGGAGVTAVGTWCCVGLALHLSRYYGAIWASFRHHAVAAGRRWPRRSADADFVLQAITAAVVAVAVWR